MKEVFVAVVIASIPLIILIYLIETSIENYTLDPTEMQVICIENVEYWFKRDGYSAVMSPRFDAETGDIVVCD